MQHQMPVSASRLLEISEKRDKMHLGMAAHAAKVKAKSRKVDHENKQQMGYRKVLYKKFNGRRDKIMAVELLEEKRSRRTKMAGWLKAQGRANAEEGSPRMDDDDDDEEDML